jgi:hypothetical protein
MADCLVPLIVIAIFFRYHDFCLALASTASFLIPITAYMAWRSLVRGLQQLATNPIMQRRRR